MTVDTLIRVCEVPMEAALPPIYTQLANASKTEAIRVLQACCDQRGSEPESSCRSPIVTPSLFRVFASGDFAAKDGDDITGGLSIFLTVIGYSNAAAAARQEASAYSTIYSGQGAPDMQQVQALTKAAPSMPESTMMMLAQYKCYATLLDVALGPDHRVAQHFRTLFVPALEQKMPEVEMLFPDVNPLLPVMLRHTQIAMADYFQEAAVLGATATMPPVMQLLSFITYCQWASLPNLPQHLLTPPAAPTPAELNDNAGRSRSNAGADNAPITNSAPVQRLIDRWQAYGRPLRTITANNSAMLPKNKHGKQLCLSFHLRRSCNSGCR